MIHTFKGGKPYEFLSRHFDLTDKYLYFDIVLKGRILYYQWNNDHKIQDKIIYQLSPA